MKKFRRMIREDHDETKIVSKYAAAIAHTKKNEPNKKLAETQPEDAGGFESNDHGRMINKAAVALDKDHPYSEIPHKGSIKDYTNNSTHINLGLYRSHINGYSHDDPEGIKLLDAAVGHHKLKHDLTVYSGVTKRVVEDAAKHPERKVYHPSYVSSSLSPIKAAQFTKEHRDEKNEIHHHMLRIHLKAGHKMLPVLRNSQHKSENEVIIPRGHTFKISENPHESYSWNEQYGNREKAHLHIWDAHIHDGDDK